MRDERRDFAVFCQNATYCDGEVHAFDKKRKEEHNFDNAQYNLTLFD